MSNDLTKAIEDEKAMLAVQGGGDDGDGFDTIHDEGRGEYVRGTLFTFADKEFKDRDGNRLNDAELIVIKVKRAWRKFIKDDGGDGGHFMFIPPGPNGYLCNRNELGDLDQSKWEVKFKELQDPWQNTRYLWMFDPVSAQPFTFVTTSGGGRHSIESKLLPQIGIKRRLQPGVSPIVKLGWAPWGKQFPKSRPDFEVVRWIALGGQPEPQPLPIYNPLGGGDEPPAYLDAPSHDHVPDYADDHG
jgi:hypothetical protein